jgi:hypothetical protein
MDNGIEYKVTNEGLNILLKGEQYKKLGLRVKEGTLVRPFLKAVKKLVKELNILISTD